MLAFVLTTAPVVQDRRGSRFVSHIDRMRQASAPSDGKRPPRSRSAATLPEADASESSSQAGVRRPFLRVLTHGIPRMLRRGPQQSSPLQPAAAAAPAKVAGSTAPGRVVGSEGELWPQHADESTTSHSPLVETPAPAVPMDALAMSVSEAAESPSLLASQPASSQAVAGSANTACAHPQPAPSHALACATPAPQAAPLHTELPPSSTTLPQPDSAADLLELSPQVDVGVDAAATDAPAIRSYLDLPTAASELGMTDSEGVDAANAVLSPLGVSGLPAAAAPMATSGLPADDCVPGDDLMPADSAPVDGDIRDGRIAAIVARLPGAQPDTSPDPRSAVLRQSSHLSHASSQAVGEQQAHIGVTNTMPGSAVLAEVSDADASDGAAVLSDAQNSNSVATPDSSTDEGVATDVIASASPPVATGPWPTEADAGLASGSPVAARLTSVKSVSGGTPESRSSAGGTACDPGHSSQGKHRPSQARSAGMALGESVGKAHRHSGNVEGDDDTTTCSDDIPSVMSTVGAPSEVDIPVGSNSGASRAIQGAASLPDMMHQDPAQAALLNLHMLGKAKHIKKGSYIISTDGAVVRAKKRPSQGGADGK